MAVPGLSWKIVMLSISLLIKSNSLEAKNAERFVGTSAALDN